jgi:hypothetical protein
VDRPTARLKRACWLLFSLLLSGLATWECKADDVTCRAGDQLQDIAKRLLPENTELAHPAVELSLPASEHSIVVLRRPADGVSTNFEGFVLVPHPGKSCSYEKFALPKMIEPPGRFEIRVEAVFAAAAGAPNRRDLVVLYAYHRNGAEGDDGYASYIYAWNGSGFESQPRLADQVVGLKTASAVRAKLRTAR